MNLLLLRPDDDWLDRRSVQLDDQRAHHIRTVLKPSVGDSSVSYTHLTLPTKQMV